MEIATFVGGLPPELKAFIVLVVGLAVRAVLAGRVAEEWLTELAAVISTALIAIVELALNLIPPQFDALVASILQVLGVLVAGIVVARAYVITREAMFARKKGAVRF